MPTGLTHRSYCLRKLYLVVLEAMEQHINVKSRDVVPSVDVRIELLQLCQQESQQSSLAALSRQQASSVAFAHGRLVGLAHSVFKACNNGMITPQTGRQTEVIWPLACSLP